jgi:hypothetical protein
VTSRDVVQEAFVRAVESARRRGDARRRDACNRRGPRRVLPRSGGVGDRAVRAGLGDHRGASRSAVRRRLILQDRFCRCLR